MHLDSLFLFKLSHLPSYFPALAPLIGDPRFPAALYTDLGAVGLTTMGWLSAMDAALKLQQSVCDYVLVPLIVLMYIIS
jgi:hypothetical protein